MYNFLLFHVIYTSEIHNWHTFLQFEIKQSFFLLKIKIRHAPENEMLRQWYDDYCIVLSVLLIYDYYLCEQKQMFNLRFCHFYWENNLIDGSDIGLEFVKISFKYFISHFLLFSTFTIIVAFYVDIWIFVDSSYAFRFSLIFFIHMKFS